jgi:hypothetical protein
MIMIIKKCASVTLDFMVEACQNFIQLGSLV